jgi:hypothetical protein
VWLQLGLPDAEEHFLKAELVLRLDKAVVAAIPNSLGLPALPLRMISVDGSNTLRSLPSK